MLLLILTACGTAPDPSMNNPELPTEMANHSPGMAMPPSGTVPFDQMFIDMMVPHHQGAVEMATIAQARAEHAELKDMAATVIASQEAEIGKMKGWRKAWFGSEATPAMGMPTAHSEMPSGMGMMNMGKDIEALKTATPFDLAFLDAMIGHHQGAVLMAQHGPDKAQHDELKSLAADITRPHSSGPGADPRRRRQLRRDVRGLPPRARHARGGTPVGDVPDTSQPFVC